MNAETWTAILYALNFALLFTHQIDSAYWKEWELFRIPGGVQFNLLVNFVLLLVALGGFSLVLDNVAAGYVFAFVLAAAGIFALAIHGYFLLRGDSRFRLPASVAVLLGSLVVSLPLGALGAVQLAG